MVVEVPGTQQVVTGAIRQASRVTGTNFQYLVATAQVESKLNPAAAASTSSARGLFQFIEQTWLTTLKEQGAALGYGEIAKAIERGPSGQYKVADPRLSNRILNLRADPTVNAVMAGAYTKVNAGKLADRLGRNATDGELYVAHFLGPNGASRLISLAEARPGMRADEAFPGPARANRSIFYDRQGGPRSVADVYRALVHRYEVARGPKNPAAPQPAAKSAVPAMTATAPPQRPAFSPDLAALAETYAAAARLSAPSSVVAEAAPMFHGLFRSSVRREAVAPLVNALWTAPSPVPEADPQAVATQAASVEPNRKTLGLFQDQVSDARALFRGGV